MSYYYKTLKIYILKLANIFPSSKFDMKLNWKLFPILIASYIKYLYYKILQNCAFILD